MPEFGLVDISGDHGFRLPFEKHEASLGPDPLLVSVDVGEELREVVVWKRSGGEPLAEFEQVCGRVMPTSIAPEQSGEQKPISDRLTVAKTMIAGRLNRVA